LIVNADDLGLSAGVNAGIVEAHAHGVVTSASLMALRPAAAEAAEVARAHPSLSVGLHLDLDGMSGAAADTVAGEAAAQLEAFRRLLGRDPTHIDSHHHVHESEPVAGVAVRLARSLRIPLRGREIPYEGRFYGRSERGDPQPDSISAERLLSLVEALPGGWAELGCHPGIGVGEETSYAIERESEVAVLCDPRVRAGIDAMRVRLRSFADVRWAAADLPPDRSLDSGHDGGG
jgi:predicted glycoside hydrolase/deacetylase ChbG (UPF0249 family)